MTTAPPPRETYEEGVARLVAGFYKSGGWTEERRRRLRPFLPALEGREVPALGAKTAA